MKVCGWISFCYGDILAFVMGTIWNLVFIEPITQSLFFLNDVLGNLGWAIIALTLIIQLFLSPLRIPSLRAAEKMKKLKPDLDGLKDKHKDDPQALIQAQMALYKEHGVSPFGGILPMLLTLPIIIALYSVLRNSINAQTSGIHFFWLNLSEPDPFYILPIFVFIVQWLLIKFTTQQSAQDEVSKKKSDTPDMTEAMQKNMQLLFPIMLGIITLQSPSGLGIYFFVSALFAIIQQVWIRTR